MELVESNYTRSTLLEFILNPCFLEAVRLEREDVNVLINIIDNLNIFYGYNEKDKKSESNISKGDIYTWQNGLRRLRLGRIMDTEEFKNFLGLIPFHNKETGDVEKLDSFIYILERLLSAVRDLKNLTNKKISGVDWGKKIGNFIDNFIVIPEEYQEENFLKFDLKEKLERLDAFDKAFIDDNISFIYIREFIKTNLQGTATNYGNYLSGGVTVAGLFPMRPIPFRIIYILGMNEGKFPGKPSGLTLDLRSQDRKVGDIDMVEQNSYLFLETLFSVKEKLYITYNSHDLQKDAELYPSLLINKLTGLLDKHILTSKYQITKLPLKGESFKYFEKDNPFSDILVNYNKSDRLLSLIMLNKKYNISISGRNHDKTLTDEIANSDIITHYTTSEIVNEKEKDTNAKMTIKHISDFIKNPAEAKIKYHLNLHDEDTDLEKFNKEDEPFYTDNLVNYVNALKTTDYFIENSDSEEVLDFIDNMYYDRTLTGDLPEGIFGEFSKAKFVDSLKYEFSNSKNSFATKFKEIKNNCSHIKRIIIGDVINDNKDDIKLPPITFNVNNRQIDLVGIKKNIFYNKENNVINTFLPLYTTSKQINLPKQVLPEFAFYLTLLNSNNDYFNTDNLTILIHVFFTKDSIYKLINYQITKKEAYEYLKEIISDLIDEQTFDNLPFNEIVNYYPKKLQDIMDSSKDFSHLEIKEYIEEKQTEVIDIFKLVKPVIPEDARKKIMSRYKYFTEN